jgi:hypothetical protein
MADLLKYRYTGGRDVNGLPTLSLTHPVYGGIPARDLYESDVAQMTALDERMGGEPTYSSVVGYLDTSPLYAKVTQSEARSAVKERGDGVETPDDGNRSSPGLPDEQLAQVDPPGSAGAGPMGAIPSGPPTDAEAQMATERALAADNPAISDNPPPSRRGGKG